MRHALNSFDAGMQEDGFMWLMLSAKTGADDREWIRRIADEMWRHDTYRVWEVWQVRCNSPDAGAQDFLELARSHMSNVRGYGPGVPPLTPSTCPLFDQLKSEYRLAVEAMREAVSRSQHQEEMAQLMEETATYHAHFGRYFECKIVLESVSELRPPRNRWRFSDEPEDTSDTEVP